MKPTMWQIKKHLNDARRFYAAGKTEAAVYDIKAAFRMAQQLQAVNTKEYVDKQKEVVGMMEQINALTHAMVQDKRKREAAEQETNSD